MNETDRPVVVGAGPAGLAAAACLEMAGIRPIVLEAGATAGTSWLSHYDRLHLHTDSKRSSLPGLRFPKSAGKYPSRDDVVDYLATYATHHRLDVRYGQRVEALRSSNQRWVVVIEDAEDIVTEHVVVATGYTADPVLPEWEGQDSFVGPIVHSADYRNGLPFQGKDVLVVGFGNSAGEIAIDLVEHGATVSMSVRRPVTITRKELLGIPILAVSIPLSRIPIRLADTISRAVMRIAFGDAPRYGLELSSTGAFSQVRDERRTPLIDIGTMALVRAGDIRVQPGIRMFRDGDVVFADDTTGRFDAIVAATGHRPTCNRLFEDRGRFDADGSPLGNVAGRNDGIFFTGFKLAPTGALYQISREAREISRSILADVSGQLQTRVPSTADNSP